MLKITIITVCRNAAVGIRQTIESVVSQTYSNIEYLVIDGCSTDGTLDIVKSYFQYENMRVFSEQDFGIYNAMNRGITRASGDYIYFLNAGDTLYDDKVIENVVAYILKDVSAIYYGKVKVISPGTLGRIVDFDSYPGSIEERILDGRMPNHQGIFAPRSSLTDHYFREKFKLRADYEWLYYSIRKDIAFKNMPFVIANYNDLGVSRSIENKKNLRKETESIIAEYGQQCGQNEKKDIQVHCDNTQRESMWKMLSDNHFRRFLLLNKWMIIKQKGISIIDYLMDRNINNVAIYGISYLGERILEELKKSDINVCYLIDRKGNYKCSDLAIYTPDAKLPEVDAIIVSAIIDFNEINTFLVQRNQTRIISLEAIIEDCLSQCLYID